MHLSFNDTLNPTDDSSPNNNLGFVSIGPIVWVTSRDGDWALDFDGINDRVDVVSDSSLSTTSLTLSAWVYMQGPLLGGLHTIVEHNRLGANWYGLWESQNGNLFQFRWANSGFTDFLTTISPNTWYHVVGTYDASTQTVKTYVNGALDSIVGSFTTPTPLTAGVRIGRNQAGSEALNGIIDDVRIYDVALDDAEVTQLYNLGTS